MQAAEELKQAESSNRVIELVEKYNFTHEMIPSKFKKDPKIWEALLQNMPLNAMVRSLAPMTSCGLLKPMSNASKLVCSKLESQENLQKARLHPINILSALNTYQSGRGVRGSLTWQPVQKIVDSLDDAFYMAFQTIEPTGKRIMLGIDCSGSMGMYHVAIPGLDARTAAAVMAMVTAKVEKDNFVMGFSHNSMGELNISPKMRLGSVIKTMEKFNWGYTDCALPMIHAQKNNLDVDVFHVYTDCETWCGNIHPHQALNNYRKKFNIPAKLAVVGMASNGFSIADSSDAGMMDFVGFDSSGPKLLADFARQG